MEDQNNAPLKSNLRQKAEELLRNRPTASIENYSDEAILNLFHELEIRQIELEVQNEELNTIRNKAEIEAEKYTNLYDFAPCGYFTITSKDEILELNYSGAALLGKERPQLLKKRFAYFIDDDSKLIFSLFLDKVFETRIKQSCEIAIKTTSGIVTHCYLSGIVNDREDQCLLTMVDISELKNTTATLIKSELLLKSTLESQQDTIIFSIDKDYKYLSFNKAHSEKMKQFFNIDIELGLNVLSCIMPLEGRQVTKENFDCALNGQSRADIGIYGTIEQGHFESFYNPIRDENNQIIGATVLSRNIENRIQNENNLKISKENLQSILDSVSDAIYVLDISGIFIDANKGAEKMYLCSKQELIGTSFTSVAAPNLNDIDEVLKISQTVFETGNEVKFEFWAVRKNGEIFPKEVMLNKGKYLGENAIIVCARDISARKKIETSLQKSQEKLQGLFNVANSGIILLDNNSHFLMFNDWCCNLLDYSKTELQTLNSIIISHPNDREKTRTLQNKMFEGEIDTYRIEKRFIKKDKTSVWCEVSASVIRDQNNKVINIIKVIHDITAQKQAEQALIDEKRRLALILIGTNAGTWEWNIQTGIIIINERWADLIGYTIEELSPVTIDTWRGLSHSEDVKIIEILLEKHFKGSLEHYEAEFRMKHKNGDWVWILSRGKISEWDVDGEPLLMSGTHLNITKRKLAEEKLITSEAELRQTQIIANLGSFSLDFTTRKWSCCPVLDKIFGIEATFEKTMQTWNMLLHPDWVAIVNDYVNIEVIGKRNNFNKEYKIVSLDRKEEKWVHSMGKITFDDNGNPKLLVGSVQDITERKIIEEELKLTSEKLQDLVNSSGGIVWEADAETFNFTFVSQQAERLLGYAAEEWYQEGFWTSHLHPEDKIDTINYCASQTEIMQSHDFTYRFIAKNGETIWLRDITNVVVEEGKPRWLRGVMFDVTHLKETNLLLTESEEKYRGLVENAPYGIIIYVGDKVAFINAEVIKMAHAKDKNELIGRSVLDFVHPDSMEDIAYRMTQVHRDENASDIVEARLLTIDGNSLYVELKAIPTVYEHQQAVQLIIQDISLQKQSQLDLNKINRVYAFISKINNLIIRTHNREDLFQEICNIAVNFGNFRLSWIGFLNDDNTISTSAFAGFENGYFAKRAVTSFSDVQEQRGPTRLALSKGRAVICNDIAHDEMMQPFREEALSRGYYSMISIPILVRNKYVAAFNLYSDEKNFFSSEEEIILLEKITLNIAFALESILIEEERKEADEKIRKLSQAVEQSPATIIITDTNGNIEYVNPKFVASSGYSFEEVVGKNPRFLKSGHTSDEEYKTLWETISKGHNWHSEFYNKKKDGTMFWESSTISPLLDEQGKTTHFIAINENITDRKIAEQELLDAKLKAEESDRLKLAFLANMSHEIRTPMNGILGFTELLKEPDLSGAKQSEFISIIEKSGKRMLNIINDIISISKVEAGQIEISLSDTNINEQLYYIHSFFTPEANQKGIKLIIKSKLPPTYNILLTDNEKLYAILTNLVKNAIKFTNEGSIKFGCEKKGKFIEFFVKDSGIGISASQQDIIFERFRQASESVSRSHEGSGLGLAISKAYIEKMGGRIWVESKKDKGSTFYFTIPFQSESQNEVENYYNEPCDTEHKNREQPPENKIIDLKVLIVEDDPISKLLLTFVLKPYSKQMLKASSGIEAIEICKSNPDIDLVMMDVNMPVMGGYEATEEIRKFNKDLVIIAQTANALQSDRKNAIDSGCTDYISKPINADEFKALMDKYFSK